MSLASVQNFISLQIFACPALTDQSPEAGKSLRTGQGWVRVMAPGTGRSWVRVMALVATGLMLLLFRIHLMQVGLSSTGNVDLKN